MFDISFFELLVIAVVGLIVIGPERLPGAIRTGALWLGRIKRSLAETRQELEKQIGADEIRRELHNEQVLHNLAKMKDTRLELEERIRRITTGEYLNDDSGFDTTKPASETSTPPTGASSEQPPPNYDEHAIQSAPSDSASQPSAAEHPPAVEPPKP